MNSKMNNVTCKVQDLATLIACMNESATQLMADEYFTKYGNQVASDDLLSAIVYNQSDKTEQLVTGLPKPLHHQTASHRYITQEMIDRVDVALITFKKKWQGIACFFDTGGWGAPADKYDEVRADWCKTIKTLKDDNISTKLLATKFDLSERSIQRIVKKLNSADGW